MPERKPSWEIDEKLSKPCIWISKLMVLQSAAGYYIGRMCADNPVPGWYAEYYDDVLEEPYYRDSGYFTTRRQAQQELDTQSYEVRQCVENDWARQHGFM